MRAEPRILRDPDRVNHLVRETMDRLLQDTDALYITKTSDLTDGTALYCFPELYYIEGVIIERDTTPVELKDLGGPLATAQMDRVSPSWRTDPQDNEPAYSVTEGRARIHLSPTPNYTTTSGTGLRVRGLGVWGTTTWDADDEECPIALMHHQTVVDGLTEAMLATFCAGTAPHAAAVQRFASSSGRFWRQNMALSEQLRASGPTPVRLPVGPLNL